LFYRYIKTGNCVINAGNCVISAGNCVINAGNSHTIIFITVTDVPTFVYLWWVGYTPHLLPQ
jgi:hypothetical protein